MILLELSANSGPRGEIEHRQTLLDAVRGSYRYREKKKLDTSSASQTSRWRHLLTQLVWLNDVVKL